MTRDLSEGWFVVVRRDDAVRKPLLGPVAGVLAIVGGYSNN